MKFRCERDVLAEALSTTSRAVAGRGAPNQVLSGVHLQLRGDQLSLLATDLDLTIALDVEVSGHTDGAAVVPARLAVDIVKALSPGAVDVEVGDVSADIASGPSRFSVRTFAVDDFPRTGTVEAEPVRLSASTLTDALRQVVPAASRDQQRAILTGVLLLADAERLHLVATDSYRLAKRELPNDTEFVEGRQVVIPAKALDELNRLLGSADEVEARLGERDASFQVGSVVITTRLIEGEFPQYQALIPRGYPNRLVADRAALLEAVRRVKLLAREATPVRLLLSPGSVELLVIDHTVGEAREHLSADYEGGEIMVAFNPQFLVEGIEAVGGEQVALETLDPGKPALLRPVDSDVEYLYLLMPIRVP